MKEFGSDFHNCSFLKDGLSIFDKIGEDINFYINGRQALQAVIKHNVWKRIWVPSYFCYEVVDAISETGIDVQFYEDSPLINDCKSISKIEFHENDVLLRINYFGTRARRSNKKIPVSVIEDHSHDLIGDWAINSDANWCIASLRKTLPIADGGILWSPKKMNLPTPPKETKEGRTLSKNRWLAMDLKEDYLGNDYLEKDLYRQYYIETENNFRSIPMSLISHRSLELVKNLDIKWWYKLKRNNWTYLYNSILKNSMKVSLLQPENEECNIFSLIFFFENNEKRDYFRISLIKQGIYPAILWKIPKTQLNSCVDLGDKILSIPCDGRYNDLSIECMMSRIFKYALSNI